MFNKARQFINAKLFKTHSNRKKPKVKNLQQEDPAHFGEKSKDFEGFLRFILLLSMSGFLVEFGGFRVIVPSNQQPEFCQQEASVSYDDFSNLS